jgi:hypothetical protein
VAQAAAGLAGDGEGLAVATGDSDGLGDPGAELGVSGEVGADGTVRGVGEGLGHASWGANADGTATGVPPASAVH